MLRKTCTLSALVLAIALTATATRGGTDMNERYDRGWAALSALAPEKARTVQESLADIAPDMARFVVEFGYGDVFTRPGLSPALRQTATIAALAALGNAAPQLRFHIEAGLAAGLSPAEIIEILYVTTVFAGFPAGLNGLAAARQVFADRGVTPPPPPLPKPRIAAPGDWPPSRPPAGTPAGRSSTPWPTSHPTWPASSSTSPTATSSPETSSRRRTRKSP